MWVALSCRLGSGTEWKLKRSKESVFIPPQFSFMMQCDQRHGAPATMVLYTIVTISSTYDSNKHFLPRVVYLRYFIATIRNISNLVNLRNTVSWIHMEPVSLSLILTSSLTCDLFYAEVYGEDNSLWVLIAWFYVSVYHFSMWTQS